MKHPKTIRFWTFTRGYGKSVFILVPLMIRNFMNLEKGDGITVVYDTTLKKITIRKVGK